MALISLTRATDNTGISLEESNILIAQASTNGTTIEYRNTVNGVKDSVEVINDLTDLAEISEGLIEINYSDNSPSVAIYISSERIIDVYEENSYASVIYNKGNNDVVYLKTVDSVEDILTAVYDKKGYSNYAAESYSGNDIILPAAAGNVTDRFTAGVILTVYASDVAENNDTYEIASSAYGGGQTTITLVAGVADDTDTTGRVMIKSLTNAELETIVLGIQDGTNAFDVITEKTTGAGVTVDGVLLKDGGAVFADGASIEVDTVNEATAAAGVTIDGVLLKDGLVNRGVASVTTTGGSQTLAGGYNDVILLTTTTGTDLAKISNTSINTGHQLTLVYVAEGAGADELVLSKLNAGDGIGFTTITFSTLGDTATLCWSGSAWFIVSLRGAVAA